MKSTLWKIIIIFGLLGMCLGAILASNIQVWKGTKILKTGILEEVKEEITLPSYSAFLSRIQASKANYLDENEEVNSYLFKQLNDSIPLYWKGTKWDYNGTTRTPGSGSIACGYFVTNVLTDFGFNIRRVKLAQEPSSVMINELTVQRRRFTTIDQVAAYLEGQPKESIFIVGLDYHTGFITNSSSGNYFIHSNFFNNNEGVVREEINNSIALADSKTFMIGNLTANKRLMNKWARSGS